MLKKAGIPAKVVYVASERVGDVEAGMIPLN